MTPTAHPYRPVPSPPVVRWRWALRTDRWGKARLFTHVAAMVLGLGLLWAEPGWQWDVFCLATVAQLALWCRDCVRRVPATDGIPWRRSVVDTFAVLRARYGCRRWAGGRWAQRCGRCGQPGPHVARFDVWRAVARCECEGACSCENWR